MKKLLLIISLILTGFLKVSANNADLFRYDKSAVQTALSELSVLEIYVVEHPALAIVNQTKNGTLMVNGIELYQNNTLGPNNFPFGFWSIFWGCGLGCVGVLVVYIFTHSTDPANRQTLMAVEGMCLWIIIYFGFFFHY